MDPVPGNRLTLLRSGAEYFPALEAAIDAARADVRLETYIYEDDETGRRIAAALKRAAARGVSVRMMLDGFGSRLLPAPFLEDLRREGILVQVFRPEWRFPRVRRTRLRRLHRKIVLIDGRVGFVGGINIVDDRVAAAPRGRLDFCVRIEGPLVGRIYPVVHRLWWLVATLTRKVRRADFEPLAVNPEPAGATSAEFVWRDNLRHRHDIEAMFLEGIRGARRELVIASAYFLPGWRVRHALIEAAGRGVRVALLLQGWSDHRFFQQASRVLYPALLDHGIEIYEYEASELHAKAVVADDRWASVGSSNLDPFSLWLSREANVVVHDETFARELREAIELEIRQGARPVRRMLWKHRPWTARVAGWIAYGYARLVVGWAGIGRRWL